MAKLIHRAESLSSCISLGQCERKIKRKHQAQRCRKQKMSPQPAKVRTKMSTESVDRRCQAAALSDHWRWTLWKQQEMKSIKYSGLAQFHASLPTITRALIATIRTRKLYCQMQQNCPSSSIDQRLYLAASRWARANDEEEENVRLKEGGNKRCLRSQRKYVQSSQRGQWVEDARRQLCQVITTEKSESNKNWNRSNTQSWLNFMPHCLPPLGL